MTTIIFKNACFSLKIGNYSKINEYINEFFVLLPDAVHFDEENISDMLSLRFILNEISASLVGEGGKIGSFLATLLTATLQHIFSIILHALT